MINIDIENGNNLPSSKSKKKTRIRKEHEIIKDAIPIQSEKKEKTTDDEQSIRTFENRINEIEKKDHY